MCSLRWIFFCHSNCTPEIVSDNMKKTSATPPFVLIITIVYTQSLHMTCSNVVQDSFNPCFCCAPLDNVRRKPEAIQVNSIKVLV